MTQAASENKRFLIDKILLTGATITVDPVTGDTHATWDRDDYTPDEWATIQDGLLGKELSRLINASE